MWHRNCKSKPFKHAFLKRETTLGYSVAFATQDKGEQWCNLKVFHMTTEFSVVWKQELIANMDKDEYWHYLCAALLSNG